MKFAKRLENLPPYLFAQIDAKRAEIEKQGHEVISLGIGDPDQPTPENIVNVAKKAVANPKNHKYPKYFGSPDFRKAASTWIKNRFEVDVDPETEILSMIGAKEGIAHIYLALTDPGDVALVPGCGYPVYTTGALMAGAEPFYMKMNKANGFLADFESVPEDVLKKAKIMFLSYPNNPTSAIANEEYFDKAINFAKENDLLIVHDNAYSEIGYDGYKASSFLKRPGAKEVAVEFFSLSKAYNMTGWRVGFAAGNKDAIKAFGTVKSNIDTGVFGAIQDAAIEALTGPQDSIDKICALYEKRRDLVLETLNKLGLKAEKAKGTIYVWAEIPEGTTSAEFAEKVLQEAHVIVAPGTAYGPDGEGYIRISLTTPDNKLTEALERIKKVL